MTSSPIGVTMAALSLQADQSKALAAALPASWDGVSRRAPSLKKTESVRVD